MSDQAILFGALAAGAAFKLGALSWVRKARRQNFVHVGTVSSLFLYPVKSCRPVPIDSAECTETGLCHKGVTDRYWVVVDSGGSFISQRKEPSMALIETRLIGDEIELSAPGVTTFRLPSQINNNEKKTTHCRVWNDNVEVLDCGDKASAWISKYLNREGCRIMRYIPGMTQRGVGQRKWKTYVRDYDKASFGDYCSYFVLSEASLADLNTRLPKEVTMMTFRPNIVVTGCPAFAEDKWMEIRIGEKATLRYLDSCPRCILTTVNPYAGVKDPDSEPLKTLRSYRLQSEYGNSPLFGTYLGLEEYGRIQVGDPVFALL